MQCIENRTFDELKPGDTASLVRTLTYEDIERFAIMSGDLNPAHLDETCAKSDMFHRVVAHGMWGGSLISTVLGTQLPGPKTIYVDQSSHFRRPVALGDTITVTLEVQAKSADTRRVVFDYRAVNQDGGDVITGTAEVIAPTAKISRPRMVLPEVTLRRKGRRYEQLIEMTRGLNPIHTAVVHPVDTPSLLGAVEAAHAKLIVPVLVGPEHRIRAAAQAHLDLAPYEIVPTEHSEAAAVPKEAVDLFAYRIGRELGSLAAALGGIDALVFTAGIGEHAPEVRRLVCENAAWLGIDLDTDTNENGGPRIARASSRTSAWVIPTDEDLMIARHSWTELNSRTAGRQAAAHA